MQLLNARLARSLYLHSVQLNSTLNPRIFFHVVDSHRRCRYRFEALIALEELIPSIAILLLTARGRGRRNPPRSSAEVTPLGVSYYRPNGSIDQSIQWRQLSYVISKQLWLFFVEVDGWAVDFSFLEMMFCPLG